MFLLYFYCINAALMSKRDFLKHYKILPTLNFWTVEYVIYLTWYLMFNQIVSTAWL